MWKPCEGEEVGRGHMRLGCCFKQSAHWKKEDKIKLESFFTTIILELLFTIFSWHVLPILLVMYLDLLFILEQCGNDISLIIANYYCCLSLFFCCGVLPWCVINIRYILRIYNHLVFDLFLLFYKTPWLLHIFVHVCKYLCISILPR